MNLNDTELEKLFDFVLSNKNIALSENSLFDRDTLIMIRNIIRGKRQNDFELSKEQEKTIIKAFLDGSGVFEFDTPRFIRTNLECMNASIERDINSVDFFDHIPEELYEKILDLALKNNYVLRKSSPIFLKINFQVALNSIRNNPLSADYVDWSSFSKEEIRTLISLAIELGYELSSRSCDILRNNPDIALSSIKKNIETIAYVNDSLKNSLPIFRCLFFYGYEFDDYALINQPLSNLTDPTIIRYFLRHFPILNEENERFKKFAQEYPDYVNKYIDRTSALLLSAIKTLPTIRSFDGIFQYSSEKYWEDYREQNRDSYSNIFAKICGELQVNNDYNNAIDNLKFLNLMKETLEDKYNLLLQAMEEYHRIIHGNQSLSDIDYARDMIAKLSALYISMSKENFKKDLLLDYEETLSEYFIPRKNHPLVYKKIIEYKQKEAFKDLYDREDESTIEFLNSVINQYKAEIDEQVLWQMLDYFILKGYSKMDVFIKAPRGFNDYKRYEEAKKLVNRLNSNYIKYTDQELVRYLDIIKYDSISKKYCYVGPSFSEKSVARYDEYRKKQRIFEKVKQQIIFKSRTLEINRDITDEELDSLRGILPFTDEYYEFNQYYFNDFFNFDTFMESCTIEDEILEPSAIIDDEAYNVLTNFTINNSLIWFLLFSTFDENRTLEDCFDNEELLSIIKKMKDIVNLSKKFNYRLTTFSEIESLKNLSKCANEETIAVLGKDVIEKLSKYREYTDSDEARIVNIAKKLMCQMVKRSKSTVPYLNGKTTNYQYSMYDSQDETILLSGINTNACFRVDGTDNDFLHYCALDKNGFVIKITDNFGNFVARASGFRNGNGVYINQLRTIYDEGGTGYKGIYENEKREIIQTFKKACNDIVETSQRNKNEKNKIDLVFVTKSYAMSDTESNVSTDVTNKIGDEPMDTTSQDWKYFYENTENLSDCSIDTGFFTDYGSYALICMASSKRFQIFGIKPRDIKSQDVEPVYTRPRNNIIVTNYIDDNAINKVNRINAIYSYLNQTDFKLLTFPKGTTLFIGDNWYIAYNGGIISSCILEFDEKARLEYEATCQTIKQNVQIVQQSQEQEGSVRVLKLDN